MILNYDDIPRAGKAVRFSLSADALAGALSGYEGAEPAGKLSAQVSLAKTSGGGLAVEGRIRAPLTLTCARCLKVHPFAVERVFKYHLLPPAGGE